MLLLIVVVVDVLPDIDVRTMELILCPGPMQQQLDLEDIHVPALDTYYQDDEARAHGGLNDGN